MSNNEEQRSDKVTAIEIWGENPIADRLQAFIRMRDYFIPDKVILQQLREILLGEKSTNLEKLKAIAQAVQLYPELKALTPPQQLAIAGYVKHDHTHQVSEIPEEWLDNWEQRVIDAEAKELERIVSTATGKKETS